MWVQSLGWKESPGVRNDKPLQNACLKNSMDRGTWQATVHGGTESDMTEVTQHAHIVMTLIIREMQIKTTMRSPHTYQNVYY